MALSSGNDATTLRSWNFLNDYNNKYERDLVRLAESVYMVLCLLVGSPPTQQECYDFYWDVLRRTPFFRDWVANKKHIKPIFYDAFAQMLSRYALDMNWSSISSMQYP